MTYRPSKAFYVTPETDSQIDDLQLALGCSRSHVLRIAIAQSWEASATPVPTDTPAQAPPQLRTAGKEEA